MILETKDYEIFKLLKENRPIVHKLVLEKVDMLKKNNKLKVCPVLVTKDMEIIDGQHRFQACKILQIPVYYRIDSEFKIEDLQSLNNNSKIWTISDYMNFYCQRGVENYVRARDFCEKHNVASNDFMLYIECDCSFSLANIRKGLLKMPKSDVIIEERMIFLTRCINLMQRLGVGTKPFYQSNGIKRALLKFLSVDHFDSEYFIEKLESNFGKVRKCMGVGYYVSMFVDIYNLRNKNPIEFKMTSNGTVILK